MEFSVTCLYESEQCFFLLRYEVLYHKSCDVCPTSVPVNVSDAGLSRRYIVRDLSPYTMYSFKIRVYNALSSGLSGEQRVLTKATSKGFCCRYLTLNNQKNCFITSVSTDRLQFVEISSLLKY